MPPSSSNAFAEMQENMAKAAEATGTTMKKLTENIARLQNDQYDNVLKAMKTSPYLGTVTSWKEEIPPQQVKKIELSPLEWLHRQVEDICALARTV